MKLRQVYNAKRSIQGARLCELAFNSEHQELETMRGFGLASHHLPLPQNAKAHFLIELATILDSFSR